MVEDAALDDSAVGEKTVTGMHALWMTKLKRWR